MKLRLTSHCGIILAEDGTLTRDHLLFQAEASVEVIVLLHVASSQTPDRYPLRGTSYFYEGPTDPAIAEEEWNALQ